VAAAAAAAICCFSAADFFAAGDARLTSFLGETAATVPLSGEASAAALEALESVVFGSSCLGPAERSGERFAMGGGPFDGAGAFLGVVERGGVGVLAPLEPGCGLLPPPGGGGAPGGPGGGGFLGPPSGALAGLFPPGGGGGPGLFLAGPGGGADFIGLFPPGGGGGPGLFLAGPGGGADFIGLFSPGGGGGPGLFLAGPEGGGPGAANFFPADDEGGPETDGLFEAGDPGPVVPVAEEGDGVLPPASGGVVAFFATAGEGARGGGAPVGVEVRLPGCVAPFPDWGAGGGGI
jgi:hypothetical protein